MSRNKEWQVNDRVQYIDWQDESRPIYTGTVQTVYTETREVPYWSYGLGSRRDSKTETYVSELDIKWDDGEVERLKTYDVKPEDSELEREFRVKAAEVLPLIDQELAKADEYLSRAQAIADEHGIPFPSHISPLSQSYMTHSFTDKWPGVSKEVVEEVTQTYSDYDDYYGWQHSAVC